MTLTTLETYQVDSCLYASLSGTRDDSNSIEAMKVTIPVFLGASQNMVAKSYEMILLNLMNDGTMTMLRNNDNASQYALTIGCISSGKPSPA